MLPLITIVALLAFVAYQIATGIYRLYFHPLASYPGPLLWRVSRLPWVYTFVTGKMPHRIRQLHERYGDVVRTAPDELSFIKPAAWQDIYGHGNSRKFIKDPQAYRKPLGQEASDILGASDADHARFRRLLSHAFSEKALREQLELINGHVELLIQRLRERSGQQLDMVRWLNFTTFDLIGDLAFGESFGCLQGSDYHPWVALIFDSIRAATTFSVMQRYISPRLLFSLMPKRLLQKRVDHLNLTRNKVKTRLETDTTRADFMTYILRHNDEKGMSEPELYANSSLLILAGSETTATALSGTTYWLLRTPDVLQKVVAEIRGKFTNEQQMDLTSLANCEYLNLVLREGLRMYPPVPVGLPRRAISEEAIVAGHHVPKNTTVGVPQWAAYHGSTNFANPEKFDPSRWSNPDNADAGAGVYNPFSIGPRNCVGQNLAWAEMRLILARILFNFDLELLNNNWTPENQSIFVLWSKPALDVTVRDRFAK